MGVGRSRGRRRLGREYGPAIGRGPVAEYMAWMVRRLLLVIVVPSALRRISVTICHLIVEDLGGRVERGSDPFSSLAHRSAVPASTTEIVPP
jgi:hypothetical protein